MEKIWELRTEVEMTVGNPDLEPDYARGFMNIVTWATSAQVAEDKVRQYLDTVHLKLLGVDESTLVDPSLTYGDVMQDAIARTLSNPDAIILGTFHAYKTDPTD
ncbi:MAG TPA: hypothetical protein VF392_10145 [Terracidiphilus sp.]